MPTRVIPIGSKWQIVIRLSKWRDSLRGRHLMFALTLVRKGVVGDIWR